jgi:Fe(3+) dicitrate transport protein
LRKKKNFQKKKSIESLSTVIITTDAIIGVNSTPKTKQVLLILYLKRIKTFNYDDVSNSKNSTRTNYSRRRWFWLTTKHWNARTSPNRSENNINGRWVLISPAPYSAPAAYFPTVSRMQSFEILKGGSQIQYGPYTTGGAINMVSTQIPRRFQAVLLPA